MIQFRSNPLVSFTLGDLLIKKLDKEEIKKLVFQLPIYPTYSILSPLVSVGWGNSLFPSMTRPATQEYKNSEIIYSMIINNNTVTITLNKVTVWKLRKTSEICYCWIISFLVGVH